MISAVRSKKAKHWNSKLGRQVPLQRFDVWGFSRASRLAVGLAFDGQKYCYSGTELLPFVLAHSLQKVEKKMGIN
jgi:hypothetical protein